MAMGAQCVAQENNFKWYVGRTLRILKFKAHEHVKYTLHSGRSYYYSIQNLPPPPPMFCPKSKDQNITNYKIKHKQL